MDFRSCSVLFQGYRLLSFVWLRLGRMLRVFGFSWLYDRDPLEPLRFEEPLARLRSRLAAGEPVFENLIKKYLLENGHKVSVKVNLILPTLLSIATPVAHVNLLISGSPYPTPISSLKYPKRSRQSWSQCDPS